MSLMHNTLMHNSCTVMDKSCFTSLLVILSPVQVKNSVSVYIDRDSDSDRDSVRDRDRDKDKNNREKNFIDRVRDAK